MRLLLLNYEYPPLGGGAGNATAHIAAGLTKLGAQVIVLSSAYGNLPRREETDGFTIIRVPAWRGCEESCGMLSMCAYMLSASLALPGVCREFAPQACLAFFGIPGGPPALLLRALRATPYVVSLRGGDVPGFQPYDLALAHKLTGPLIRIIWKGAGSVVANSQGLAELGRKFAPNQPIEIIPNGVDAQKFHPFEGQSSGPVRILSVGRMVHQKGFDLLLAALAKLDPGLDWTLTLAGDGPQRLEYEELCRKLGLSRRVKFLGWVSRADLPALYRQAQVFAFPSRDEGMPNAVLEAMASGLAVLASRISGNRELVREGVNGYLTDPESTDELAARLTELIAGPELCAKFGQASRRIALEEYSWDEVARRYLSLLQNTATRT